METKNTETRNPTFGFALLVFALVLVVVVGGLLAFDGNLATLLFLSWLVVIAAGYYLKHKFADMENMAYDMIRRVMQPIVILLSVGAMIGAWIAAGTVPALIYYGLALISPSVFLIVAYLLCSVCSLFTGTSWGTMGTAGLAMVGVGMSMGMNPGLVAGAVICGAYFGDKLSPLSDTTNLAPAVSGAKVMNHVKHMLWTSSTWASSPCFLPFWFWFCCWPVSRPSSPFFWVQFWAPSLRLSIRALTLPRFCPFYGTDTAWTVALSSLIRFSIAAGSTACGAPSAFSSLPAVWAACSTASGFWMPC